MINPVLVFDRETLAAEYNYCYIPEFQRYYFVTNYIYSGALLEYHLSIDVLATFRNTIGNSSQYVLRSAYEWDGSIIDAKYPTKANPTVHVSYAASTPWSNASPSDGCYCIGIAGTGGIRYYVMNYTGLTTFFGYLLSDAYVVQVLGDYLIVDPSLKLAVDPLQYISSCIWLPFVYGTLGNQIGSGIPVGNVTVPSGYCYGLDLGYTTAATQTSTITLAQVDHPLAASRGRYLNSGAYSSCSVYLPPYGMIDVDATILAGNSGDIKATFITDVRLGECKMTVYVEGTNPSDDHIITVARFQNSVNIPMTQVIAAGGIGLKDVLAPVIGAVGSAIAGDYVGAAGGLITGAMSAIESAGKNRIPEARQHGSAESMVAWTGYPYIQYVWEIPVDDDLAQHGRPLCKVRQLSNIPGYILCANTELAIAGTAEEEVRIRGYLESGFFYE